MKINSKKKKDLRTQYPLSFLLRAKTIIAISALYSYALFIIPSYATDKNFFKIGAGYPGGGYFSIGALIAYAISKPQGARSCEKGGICGVENLNAVTRSSSGSAQNIHDLCTGKVDMALVQADIAWQAWANIGRWKNTHCHGLRIVARLYDEHLHFLINSETSLTSLEDIKGQHIAVGSEGSGTLETIRNFLSLYNLEEKDFFAYYIDSFESSILLEAGKLDGFFVVTGYPNERIDSLVGSKAELLSLPYQKKDAIFYQERFWTLSTIPETIYTTEQEIKTIRVPSLLLAMDTLDNTLVYEITKSLWHPRSLEIYQQGHSLGEKIDIANNFNRGSIPFHVGAFRYYQEALEKR